jgi:hypothetical protein
VLERLQIAIRSLAGEHNLNVVNLASPWAEIKPKKAKKPEGPKEMLNG